MRPPPKLPKSRLEPSCWLGCVQKCDKLVLSKYDWSRRLYIPKIVAWSIVSVAMWPGHLSASLGEWFSGNFWLSSITSNEIGRNQSRHIFVMRKPFFAHSTCCRRENGGARVIGQVILDIGNAPSAYCRVFFMENAKRTHTISSVNVKCMVNCKVNVICPFSSGILVKFAVFR